MSASAVVIRLVLAGTAMRSWQRGSRGLAVAFGLVAVLPAVDTGKALPWPSLVVIGVLAGGDRERRNRGDPGRARGRRLVWSWQRGSRGLAVVFALRGGAARGTTLAKRAALARRSWSSRVLVAVAGVEPVVADVGDGDPLGRPVPPQGRRRLHRSTSPGSRPGRR